MAFEYLSMAVLAFVPQLLSFPGAVDADTKSYLYYDPGKFLRQSATMWDPTTGLGTVTHFQLGYLFPMGPFFWAGQALGLPMWVTQRLWVGAILFGAGAGVLYLLRVIGLGGPGRPVAALAYMLSPYFLQYVGHASVLILPWAALPWMVAFTDGAVRRGGWRYPALFALVVLAVSGVNATSLVFVVVAPVLWLAYLVLVTKEATAGAAWAALWRTGVLTAAVSVWWAVGLSVEAGYGLDVLKYTETVPVIASTSLSSEVLRGLGYWYFYGGDNFGPWILSSVQLTQQPSVVALSLAVPAAAFVAAVVTRWTKRAYFVVLVVVGMVLAVGAYPYNSPTPIGAVLKALMNHTTAGAALRSSDRATPLVSLGLAVLLGAGVTALWRRRPKAGLAAAAGAVALVVLANPAVWNGTTVTANILEPTALPGYLLKAAHALNHEDIGTSVLGIPGQDFAYYRYGDTTDPIYPALLTRPFVTREQQVLGSLPSLDLLYALDSPMQQGIFDPASLAPLARLMGAGDVLVQNDLAYELYDQPVPPELWQQLDPPPAGLAAPVGFGAVVPTDALIAEVNEKTLAGPSDPTYPAPLETMAVNDPRPMVRAEPVSDDMVIDGDGVGLVDAADAGIVNGNPTIVYAGTLDTDPVGASQVDAGDATLVVTDTNRKQGFRWNTLMGNAGSTETAGAGAPTDPTDVPLDIFPGAPADAQTTATIEGVAGVTASSYGNEDTYLPQDRPDLALDGNPDTAWEVGAATDPDGQWWQVTLKSPVTTNHITLTQPQVGDIDRWITKVTLTFDGGHSVTVTLGKGSRGPQGQTLTFPARTFRKLRITVDTTTPDGNAGVGLSEVAVGGARTTEVIDMPEDLMRSTGTASSTHPLVLLFTRLRGDPSQPGSDIEANLDRSFWLPTVRDFSLSGTARIDTLTPDTTLNALLGTTATAARTATAASPSTATDASSVVVSAGSSSRLPGDLADGVDAALDDDPSTAWETAFGDDQVGQNVSVTTAAPITFDHLDLSVVADGYHSVPTALRVSTENGSVNVKLAAVPDGERLDDTASMPVRFPALTGRHITVTVTAVRVEKSKYYGVGPLDLPIGIASLGIAGATLPPPPADVPSPCRSDLLAVDGKPVWIKVSGTTDDALAGQGLGVTLCGPDGGGLSLGPGTHTLQSSVGAVSGIDLDQLMLSSAPGGQAPAPSGGASGGRPGTQGPGRGATAAPKVRVLSQGTTTVHVRVGAAKGPFWLVLGQSINAGWRATVDGGAALGAPTLIDGFANGWLVNPAALGTAKDNSGDFDVTLTWEPQKTVDAGLLVSGAGTVVCVGLVVAPAFTRRRRRRGPEPGGGRSDRGRRGLSAGPVLASPGTGDWHHPSRRAAVAVTVAGAAVGAVLGGPLVGLVTGVGALAGASLRGGRALVRLGAVVLVVATGGYYVVHQAVSHFREGGGWPTNFAPADLLTWMAVSLLFADVWVAWLLRRGPRGSPPRPPPT